MSSGDIPGLLKAGIQAAKTGEKAAARAIFEQVIQLDSRNEVAWMWLASVVETPAERQKALQRVLSINPNNEKAQQALAKLGGPPAAAASGERIPSERPSPAKAPPVASPPPSAPAPAPTASNLPARPANLGQDLSLDRPARRTDNSLLYLLGGVLVLVLLGAAAFLAFLQLTADEEALLPTPESQVSGPPTVLATIVPPTATRPVRTIDPNSVVNFGDLPATWTPSPTATSLPATETPPPPSDPGLFQVVFSGAENPVEPARLLLVRGDGSALETVEIEIIEEGPQPTPTLSAPPTLTSTPIEPSEEGTLVFEAEESTPDPGPSLNNPEAVAGFNRLEFTDPAWSPNGQEIAFTVQINEGQQEVFILNRASGRVRPITRFGASIVDGAAWSPDGRQVAVSSNYTPDGNNDRFNIYLIDVQTGEWQTLTDEEGQNREPNWAPDGRSLIFSSDRQTPGELEIWRIELATNQLTQLTNDINSSFSPQFSTDGARIAFISNRGGDNDLYIMRGDGSDERLITTLDEGADDRDPAWSPDDQWLLLSSNRQTGGALQLWLLQPDGTAWQVITEGLGNSRFPQWRSLEQ